MDEPLTEESVMIMLDLARRYAVARNLVPDLYLDGITEPLIRDGMELDLDGVVSTLIRYHTEWLER